MLGFKGKILSIDLTEKTWKEVTKGKDFYRKYLGGSFLAAKLFQDLLGENKNFSPFDPENPLVFATGLFAGENVCGATRVNVFALSPETTGTYLSQAGGEFGPELKRAGFDGLVIVGKANSPLYVKIRTEGGKCVCEFIDANHLWGKDRVETDEVLKKELEKKYSTASIGPAGENLVACANIMFEVDHYAGRGGLGAVMGSKNLKAICVSGDSKPEFENRTKVMEINKAGAKRQRGYEAGSFMKVLEDQGTFGLLDLNQAAGNLPTYNFKQAFVDSTDFEQEISHVNINEKYVGKKNACKACYVACKKKYDTDSEYADFTALAEYESIAILGPNLGLTNDLDSGLKACEICNRLGMDTISAGSLVAWLMDCFENEVLEKNEVGYSIKFGDGEKACQLLENIAFRKNKIGNLLADGVFKAVSLLGEQTKPFLRAARGVGLPAHMPRKKPGIGFGYLTGPNPGDHMKLEHDWITSDPDSLTGLGLCISSEPDALDKNKVEIGRKTQIYYSMVDTLSLCMFIFGPGNIYTFDEIAEMVSAATGLDLTFQDLMKIGEDSLRLQRELYYDLGGKDEAFLSYLADEIPAGPSKGSKINESDFKIAREHYNSLW
jgi:aldehyde:ferredoxin oxidoreductase